VGGEGEAHCLCALALQLLGTQISTADDTGEHTARHERCHRSLAITIAQQGEACSTKIGFVEMENALF
jgi:hypothetical protein